MTINIEEYFEKPKAQEWLGLAAKSLKLENSDDLKKYTEIIGIEGLTYNAYPSNTEETYLNTYPTNRLLGREILVGQPNNESTDVGIDYLFAYQPVATLKQQKLIQIKNTKETKLFGDEVLLDVFSLLKEFDFSEEELSLYIEKNLKHDHVHLLVNISDIHNAGGSVVQELSHGIFLALKFCHAFLEKERKICFMLPLDSQMFTQVAKVRALRYLMETILEHEKLSTDHLLIIGLNSLREQTIYDPWMNMLRGGTSCVSAFLGGADVIIPKSFDVLNQVYEMQASSSLALRQSRNTFHILKEESQLAFVNDPARGAAVIEDLTRQIIQKSFIQLKDYKSQKSLRYLYEQISKEVADKALEREALIRKRKQTLSGVNDYANTGEKLAGHFKLKSLQIKDDLFPVRRTSFCYEYLRLQVENDSKLKKKKNLILYYGETKKLSGRLSFCQNYFELLGLEVEVVAAQDKKIFKESDYLAIIYCALDEDYPEFFNLNEPLSRGHLYIAGKQFEKTGLTNIYQGQDVFSVLEELIQGDHS